MHRIRLELSIEMSSRWHTGAGEGSLNVDRMIRRDCAGRPFVPGSTLKGIVRENCERLARTFGFPAPLDPHSVAIRDKAAFGPLREVFSPIEALFGTKYEGGELFFRDARMAPDTESNAPLELARTSMSRGLRTVRKSHLFTSEYAGSARLVTAVDGYHRHLVASAEDDLPFAYCLLVAGVLAVTRVGADKSTGSGMAAVTINRAEYNGSPFLPEAVFDYFDAELYELSVMEVQEAL